MNELLLWRAVIDNAIDHSLNMADPGKQQEDIDWFYSDHYETMYKICYGVSGDALRERLEPLWEDTELHPANSVAYRRIFNPMAKEKSIITEIPRETRTEAGIRRRGKSIKQSTDHHWQRPRDSKGRFTR